MKKRILAFIVAGIAVVSLMACGPKDDEIPPEEVSTIESQEETAPPVEEPAAPVETAPVETAPAEVEQPETPADPAMDTVQDPAVEDGQTDMPADTEQAA